MSAWSVSQSSVSESEPRSRGGSVGEPRARRPRARLSVPLLPAPWVPPSGGRGRLLSAGGPPGSRTVPTPRSFHVRGVTVLPVPKSCFRVLRVLSLRASAPRNVRCALCRRRRARVARAPPVRVASSVLPSRARDPREARVSLMQWLVHQLLAAMCMAAGVAPVLRLVVRRLHVSRVLRVPCS